MNDVDLVSGLVCVVLAQLERTGAARVGVKSKRSLRGSWEVPTLAPAAGQVPPQGVAGLMLQATHGQERPLLDVLDEVVTVHGSGSFDGLEQLIGLVQAEFVGVGALTLSRVHGATEPTQAWDAARFQQWWAEWFTAAQALWASATQAPWAQMVRADVIRFDASHSHTDQTMTF